jgi:outer membrane protein, multidrug efflux system
MIFESPSMDARQRPAPPCLRRALALAAGIALAGALAGCAAPTPYQRPVLDPPAAWSSAPPAVAAAPAEAGIDIPDRWWLVFGHEELNRLVAQALTGNAQIAAAEHRIAQARALADGSRAELGPRVDAQAESTRTRRSSAGTSGAHQLGVAASLDLDLNGAQRLAVDAAGGRAQQREQARESLGVALLVELCEHYFSALSANDRIAIARASIANAESLLAVLVSREQAGASGQLEVLRQQGLLATQRAGLAPLEQQRQAAIAAIAVLSGQAPQGFSIGAATLADVRLPVLAAAVPAMLLERHPDVRLAEAEMLVAHADLHAARAAWLPQLRLNAGAALDSATLSGLFSGAGVVTGLGAALIAPLFDNGRIRAEVGAATARQAEVQQLYRQAVLAAYRDVEQRLFALHALRQQAAQQQQTLEFAQAALRLADLRYRNGATDYATVLDAQRVLFAAQDAQALTLLARYSHTLGLARALGGGAPAPVRTASR